MTSRHLIGQEGLYKEGTRKSELILLRDIEVFTSMRVRGPQAILIYGLPEFNVRAA